MNYFEDIEVFQGISVEDQINLSDFCQLKTFKSGETLFREGDMPEALYIIISWNIRVEKLVQWETKELATLAAWEMVWEMAFYGEPPKRNATAIAQGDTTVIVMLFFSLNQIISKNPKLHLKLQEIITDRMLKNKNI